MAQFNQPRDRGTHASAFRLARECRDDGVYRGVSNVAELRRPGQCSLDAIAWLHSQVHGRGPQQARGDALREVRALRLVEGSSDRVSSRGMQALDEHGWLQPCEPVDLETPRGVRRLLGLRLSGDCSIDVLVVVYGWYHGSGPDPCDPVGIGEAFELGLIAEHPNRVTARGEQALVEHGWLVGPGQHRRAATCEPVERRPA
jgi:hypothetical protein